MTDRFDLESAIMAAWQTENDLELVVEQYHEGSKIMSQDDVANLLIGLKEIHSLRMNKLWDTFSRTYQLDDYAEKREWVEITKGEIEELSRRADEHGSDEWHLEFAFAIERKLKEKNT